MATLEELASVGVHIAGMELYDVKGLIIAKMHIGDEEDSWMEIPPYLAQQLPMVIRQMKMMQNG